MKKVLLTLFIGITIAITACGPSAQQIEEKRVVDSIRVADSLALVQAEIQRIADSVTTIEVNKCVADSLAKCKKTCK